MTLVEGFGDEVLVLVVVMLVIAVVTLAWMSTRVTDSQPMSVIILDRTSRLTDLITHRRSSRTASTHSSDAGADVGDGRSEVTDAEESSVTESHQQQNITSTLSSSSAASSSSASSSLGVADCSACDRAAAHATERGESKSSEVVECIGTDSSCHAAGSISHSENTQPVTDDGSTGAVCVGEAAAAERVGSGGDLMNVCLQFVDGRRRTVTTSPHTTLGHFKRDQFVDEMRDGETLVRFILNGQELRDDSQSLGSCNISEGSVVHCLITRRRSLTHSSAAGSGGPGLGAAVFDVSTLMWPLFGLALVALWYARVVYRGFFNAMSTFCLIAISFFYVLGLCASLRLSRHLTHDTPAAAAAGGAATASGSSNNRPHQD